jgi:hypothetical protein
MIVQTPTPATDNNDNIPDGYVCTITNQLMKEPMMTKYGHHHERSAILNHLERNGYYCPITGNPLRPSNLVSNKTLEWKIKYWADKNSHKLHTEEVTSNETTTPLGGGSIGYVAIPPERFLCPLTKDVMKDPVMTKAGVNFDRKAILRWLDCSAEETCPVTQTPLTRRGLVSHSKLQWEIEQWQIQHGIPTATDVESTTVASASYHHDSPVKKLSMVTRDMICMPSMIKSLPSGNDNRNDNQLSHDMESAGDNKMDNLLNALDAAINCTVRSVRG